MDHINIPTFALFRYGTVITRLKNLKMENSLPNCGQACGEGVVRLVHKVAICKSCRRTRKVSLNSDCDSEILEKCRPFRTRAVKSRYVNVCAAVCLLLLVGGLTPQSSAAPHRTRAMDRAKRASDQENETWSNPCDYNKSSLENSLEYKPELAEKVAVQARDTLSRAKAYKDEIVKLHGFTKFEDMLGIWSGTEWLRNHSWYTDEVLPKEKELGQPVSDSVIDPLMTPENINKVLPMFSKAMKALGAGLRSVSSSLNRADSSLQRNLQNTSDNVRHVLCLTSEVIRARDLTMMPLMDSEIPKYTKENEVVKDAFLIYRDTVNFLEYVDQFFDKMHNAVLE